MSNVIKKGQYTYAKPQLITLQVPLIDMGMTAEQLRRKLVDAIDELVDQISRCPVDTRLLIQNLLEVNYIASGYVFADSREKNPGYDPIEMTRSRFSIGSDQICGRKAHEAFERGWVVIIE